MNNKYSKSWKDYNSNSKRESMKLVASIENWVHSLELWKVAVFKYLDRIEKRGGVK